MRGGAVLVRMRKADFPLDWSLKKLESSKEQRMELGEPIEQKEGIPWGTRRKGISFKNITSIDMQHL